MIADWGWGIVDSKSVEQAMITVEQLKSFRPSHEFFVGIDSDGCVFDSMELKHKECFCPAFINHFGLQPVSKYARETWEFVNLYSTSRGCNRFLAVTRALDLLATRAAVHARGVTVPAMNSLREWIARESKLGNPALEAEVKRTGDQDLARALAWSNDVNEAVRKIVRDVPPFPLVRESLRALTQKADAIVVSQTPTEALVREWREHDIDTQVSLIAGQELGTKSEHIAFAAGGKYQVSNILMIGDAPGDWKAAEANNALFFPINPGHEEQSWEQFHTEGLKRFFAGTFAGEYQQRLVDQFNRYLPAHPTWEH
jgi:phosphoglycolate phosphatase-like HAD superfamily hydrolase